MRESKGEHAAQLIDHLKKGEMAEKAEALLAGSGWLPEPLRTPGRAMPNVADAEALATTDVTEPAEAGPDDFASPATNEDEADGFDHEADEAHAFAAE